jgi:hypothetical protein
MIPLNKLVTGDGSEPSPSWSDRCPGSLVQWALQPQECKLLRLLEIVYACQHYKPARKG